MDEEQLKKLAEELGLNFADLKEMEDKSKARPGISLLKTLEIKKLVMSAIISAKGSVVPEKELTDIVKWAEETRMRNYLLDLTLEGKAGITMNKEGAAFYQLEPDIEEEVKATFENLEEKDDKTDL
jgi:hypothetical protein